MSPARIENQVSVLIPNGDTTLEVHRPRGNLTVIPSKDGFTLELHEFGRNNICGLDCIFFRGYVFSATEIGNFIKIGRQAASVSDNGEISLITSTSQGFIVESMETVDKGIYPAGQALVTKSGIVLRAIQSGR